jgi:hypothetical protein
MWKLPKATYKKQLDGQQNREMEGMNGKRHVLERGCGLETIVKTRFANKIIMFEEVLQFKRGHFLMLWLVKDNCFATNGF